MRIHRHIVSRQVTRSSAQSSVELALLIPIFIFIMVVFVKIYDTNLSISNKHTETHIDKLDLFDHGNGRIYDPIIAEEIEAGQYIENVPGSGLLNFGNPADIATQVAASIGGNYLLDFLFSKIPFFQESNIIPDAIQGFSTSALNSYINSGFTEVDWEGAGWDGATAGLSSQQATQFFQGEASKTRSAREFFGSGAQTSLKSFTSSQGDEKALLDGFVNGLMSSDSFGSWVTQKENENGVLEDRKGLEGIIMGAAGGAITSTATGALQGEVDFKKVAKGAAMGGLQSKAMADVVTSNKYSGDPRGSFSFGALNGAASTLINGGNAKDAAFAAANGAFYSQQIQVGMQDKKLLRTISNVAFQSGMSLAQGNSLETVGNSALSGAMGYGREQVGSQINGWSQTQFTQSVENATSQGGLENHPDGITSNIIENDPSLQNYAASEEAAYEDAITDSIFMNTTHYDPFGGTG